MTDIIREFREIKEYKIYTDNDTYFHEFYMRTTGNNYFFYELNPYRALCYIDEEDITAINTTHLKEEAIEFISERDECVEGIVKECYEAVEDYIKILRR